MFHIVVQSVIHDKDNSRAYKFARDVSMRSIHSNRRQSNIELLLNFLTKCSLIVRLRDKNVRTVILCSVNSDQDSSFEM